MDFLIIFATDMKEGFTGERSIVLSQATIEMERQDPLVSSLYITDIGYYPHADDHRRTDAWKWAIMAIIAAGTLAVAWLK